jgi:hypothetical protein
MNYQKYIKKIKTENFFISQFYKESQERRMIESKKNIVSKLLNYKIQDKISINNNQDEENVEDDDTNIFIKNIDHKKMICEILNNPQEIILNKI